MIGKILTAVFIFLILTTVISANTKKMQTADAQFETLAKNYIEKMLQMSPEYATILGDHRFDNRLGDYSVAGIKTRRAVNESYLKQLNAIAFDKLSQINNVDARILRENLEYNLFQIDTLREHEWNPLVYNVGNSIDSLTARDFAPLASRLTSVKERLLQIPAVVAAARANLKNPPRVYTETAIAQNAGVINLIRDDLQMFVDQEPMMKPKLAPARSQAIAALEEYGTWLKNELLPRSNKDFRLGEAKYRQKLKFALSSDLSKEELLKRAETDLKATQEEMFKIAMPLYEKYFPGEAAKLNDKNVKDKQRIVSKAVLDKLAESRPTNETIIAKANETLKQTTDFVLANNLVTVPTEPLKIIEMPEYARGTSVAYCDSTGPFEKKSSTFYAISPTPKDWDAKRSESFFREYNDFMLQDLTVHEAMPGHYLQLMHANKFKAPTPVRAIFSSGTFVEGWAVYAEQVMAEKGYGGAEVRMQQLKMKLRVIINAIIDQKIHTQGMTEKEAVDFMMTEGFQEEGEAAGKWKRAQLSSTQLSTYYVGATEVNDIRLAYEAKNKGKVNLKVMHDAMLSFGSPAAKYVKEMMNL